MPQRGINLLKRWCLKRIDRPALEPKGGRLGCCKQLASPRQAADPNQQRRNKEGRKSLASPTSVKMFPSLGSRISRNEHFTGYAPQLQSTEPIPPTQKQHVCFLSRREILYPPGTNSKKISKFLESEDRSKFHGTLSKCVWMNLV